MRSLKLILVSIFAVLVVACGGGGDPGTPTTGTKPTTALFTTAPESLTLAAGAAQVFSIGGGTAPYTATSDNPAVAVGSVVGTTLTLGGSAGGAAGINIRDAVGALVKVAVTVTSSPVQAFFTTAPSSVTVGIGNGAAQTYSVGGGAAPYLATSSNTLVATVAMAGNNYIVTGISPGTAQIVLRDSAGATLSITVNVPTTTAVALFTTAPSAVTMAVNSTQTFGIGGGTAPYSVTVSDSSVAKVSYADGSLTITGVSAGAANVLVRDAVGASVSIAVTVAVKPLSLTPNSATGIIDDVLVATIIGGKGPYRASVGNSLVTSASIAGDKLTMQLKQTGQTIVTVLDANNQSAAYSVTSNAATPGIRLSPSALTVSENDGQPITLSVFGATGSISAFSSNTPLLRATVAGNKVTVTTGTAGVRCVSANTPVTISVVDFTGALATSIITLEDNGVCP